MYLPLVPTRSCVISKITSRIHSNTTVCNIVTRAYKTQRRRGSYNLYLYLLFIIIIYTVWRRDVFYYYNFDRFFPRFRRINKRQYGPKKCLPVFTSTPAVPIFILYFIYYVLFHTYTRIYYTRVFFFCSYVQI